MANSQADWPKFGANKSTPATMLIAVKGARGKGSQSEEGHILLHTSFNIVPYVQTYEGKEKQELKKSINP